MEKSTEKQARFKRSCSISNIVDVPTTPQERRKSTIRKEHTKSKLLNRGWIFVIRIVCIISVVAIWIFFFLPALLYRLPNMNPELNKTINEDLLDSINLSSITVNCPDQYVYSKVSNKCQPACGRWSNCGYVCLYLKQAVLAVSAIIGVVVSTYAIFSWIRLRRTWKFQHYPILFCICVNLLLSISFGISDIPGNFVFYCHTKYISLDELNQNAGIHIQIQGSFLHYLGLSNRLWFLMALLHILLMICFPMKNIFAEKRARLITFIVENSLCFGLPVILEMIPYALGIRYYFFDEIDMPILDNAIANAVIGYTPHVIITLLTMTLVICILYKTRMQAIKMKEFGDGYELQTIEKRLLIFTTIYFIISAIIVVSIIVHYFIDTQINKAFEDYLSFITLNSTYIDTNSSGTETLSHLLTPFNQNTIEEPIKPLLVYIRGMWQRLMFIAVFVVISVPCPCKKKKKSSVRKPSISKGNEMIFSNKGAKA
ncbi:hypothetical protein LOD99_3326 [Oopsacas minuta]|uniref:Uncharacterized protein n=1 Tax=Oopsacas minuta TaxID=111878 RepID=A0AAV7JXR2_9METZ|nr:hypothetical protein LOD99_3326 [Oopsacas minuta]